MVLATVPVSLLSSSPALAATNGKWSVFPTTAPDQGTRPFFQPVLSPGVKYSDSVTVINQTGAPITFNLYPAAAFNTSDGGFSLRRRTDPRTGVAAWTHLYDSKVTVAPRSGVVVPFTIIPPDNVASGDYVGGIVAEDTAGVVTRHGAIEVTVLQAVGVRIYSQVAGNLTPGLAVTALSVQADTTLESALGGPVDSVVHYTVANTGNEVLSPNAVVSLSPLFGSGPPPQRFSLPQILPHYSVSFTVKFPRTVPYGRLSAKVLLSEGPLNASGTASTFVIPWIALLIVIVLLVGLTQLQRRRHRRKHPRAQEPSTVKAPDKQKAVT